MQQKRKINGKSVTLEKQKIETVWTEKPVNQNMTNFKKFYFEIICWYSYKLKVFFFLNHGCKW